MIQNVADEGQVKEAKRKATDAEKRALEDVRFLLDLPEGRRFIWRLLEKAGVFRTIFETSSKIYYNAGQQDFGHFILGEVLKANPEAYLQMMKESQTEESNA